MKCLRMGFACALLLFWASPGTASTMPDTLVENTINQLIGELEDRRAELEQDKEELYRMVEEVIVPHFEVGMIARLVLGKHWKAATETQRKQFAEEFKKLLIRTYATALFEYTGNEKMEIKPMRLKEGSKRTRVNTVVVLPGAPAIPVNYSFILTNSGDWKIYDVNIDGISLVTTYRSSYGQFVNNKGLDELIGNLREKNQALETS